MHLIYMIDSYCIIKAFCLGRQVISVCGRMVTTEATMSCTRECVLSSRLTSCF